MTGERVAVLAGGRSPEREVSLRSGHRVMTALVSKGYDAFIVDPAEVPLVETLSTATVSACYITLHGKEGEDGTVQRLIEVLDVPYTGTPPLSCEVTFDKVLAKASLDASGMPTPAWAVIEASALRDLGAGAILHPVAERVGLPLVVKPSRAGSAAADDRIPPSRPPPSPCSSAGRWQGPGAPTPRSAGPPPEAAHPLRT